MNNIVFVLLLLIVGMPSAALATSKTLASGIVGAGTQVQSKAQGRQAKAVVIGVSDYQDEYIADLRYANRDAQFFADFLTVNDNWLIPAQDLRVLVDSSATLAAIQASLAWQQRNIKVGDVAIIYFAGHGDIEVKAGEENGYLLAHDTPKNNYKLLALSVGYLNQHLDTLSARGAEVILITDACHAGTLAGDGIGGSSLTASQLLKRQGSELRILSCQPYEKSKEFEQLGGGRGAFSYYLIEAMNGKADTDANREVDLFELEMYLKENVRAVTNRSQHPEIVGGRKGELFVPVSKEGKQANLLANRQRGKKDFLFAALTTAPAKTKVNYKRFEIALRRGNLLAPTDKSALAYYQKLRTDTSLTDIMGILTQQITVALLDSVQQAIRAYLDTDPRELVQRERVDDKYSAFPAYLAAAAELLGKDDPRYAETIAKQLYFEGLVLRLRSDAKGGIDSMYNMAIEKTKAALEIAPAAAYLHNELGLLYSATGQRDLAYTSFWNAKTKAPTWALALNNFASILKEYGAEAQFVPCEEHFLEAIRLKPDFASAHMNYGNLLIDNNQIEKAEEQLRIALTLGPAFTDAYYNLGICIYDLEGKQEEAKQLFHTVLERDPDYVEALMGLGLISDFTEQPDSAIFYFSKCVTSAELNNPFSFNRLRELASTEEATSAFKQALAINPTLANAYLQWALAEVSLTNPLEALLASDLPPKSQQEILTKIAYGLFQYEAYPLAEEAFLKVIKLNKVAVPPYVDLTGFYSLQNEPVKALKILRKGMTHTTSIEQVAQICKDVAENEIYQNMRRHATYSKFTKKYCSSE